MKRYTHIALLALLVPYGLSHVVYGMEQASPEEYVEQIDEDSFFAPTDEGSNNGGVMIAPTTTAENAIVKAIEQYSNLTKADVDQYKALRFGGFSTLAAFVAGASSAVGAGKLAYEQSGAIQNVAAGRVPDWATNPLLLAGLGSVGAGLLSYKILYPPVREEIEYKMLAKVYSFINVCQILQEQTRVGFLRTIVNHEFDNLSELKKNLPEGWPIGGENADVAVYWALKNLVSQGENAQLLLNDIQSQGIDISNMREVVETYNSYLSHNLRLYDPMISQEKKEAIAQAELANLEEQKKLMQTTRYGMYGSMFKGAVGSIWNGIKEMYAHPEVLALLGVGWITTTLIIPSILNSKKDQMLGFLYYFFYPKK